MILPTAKIHKTGLGVSSINGAALYRPEEAAGEWMLVEEDDNAQGKFWLQPTSWKDDSYTHGAGILMGNSLEEAEALIAARWAE